MMSSFGERFKELRLEKQLTQQELADNINKIYNLTFGKSAVSQYENNKRTPEIYALEKFADFFNVSIDYLLGRTNERNTKEIIYSSGFDNLSTDGLSEEDIDMIKSMIDRLKRESK